MYTREGTEPTCAARSARKKKEDPLAYLIVRLTIRWELGPSNWSPNEEKSKNGEGMNAARLRVSKLMMVDFAL